MRKTQNTGDGQNFFLSCTFYLSEIPNTRYITFFGDFFTIAMHCFMVVGVCQKFNMLDFVLCLLCLYQKPIS